LTTRTAGRPVKAVPQKPPNPPGRLSLTVKRRRDAVAKAAAPYVLTYGGALAAAGVADAAGHVPPLAPLPVAVAAAALTHAGMRLWENHGWHRSGGKAAMRKRRKYQGTATRRELARNLSPAAVAKRAAITCPGLHPGEAPVHIGRAKGQDLAGSREDSYLLIAGPRFGKTALLACWAEDAPGPLLATSTRTDLYAHTVLSRLDRGDVWVLNPDGDGGVPSTLEWSPVSGCENPAVAIQRAGYLMDAAPRDPGGKDAWWDAKGAELLRLMLHAAALAGATMHQVAAWVHDPAHPDPAAILAGQFAAPGWDRKLAALAASEYAPQVAASAAAAIGWMDDPAMARAACPAGDGFNTEAFLSGGTGSVYLIGADRPHGSLAPYFAAFAADLFETAKRLASRSPGRRLPSPLTLALDEAAITCPVPLHRWVSEAGGHGVTVMAAVQAVSQLHSRWGEADGKTIFKNSTIKLFWGGDTSHDDLEAISAVCGERDTWDHSKNSDGGKTKTPGKERTVPPERLRMLGENQVLVLHRSTRAVFARVTPVWHRRGYQPADLTEPAFTPRPAQLAITSGRREAIPVPPAPPSAVERAAPVPELSSPVLTPGPCEEAVPSWHDHAATSA
jgi:type IV secretion system protein VirD4